jgi:Ca-activated chloride channel family protein
MTQPVLRFRPLRPAVAADGASTLDLLLTIATSELPAAQAQPRPPLNLALVIDRSGSMAGRKLSYARKAARFLVGELTARDQLAIVTFDDEVSVLVPSTPVGDPQLFLAAINTIHSGSSTALFDGWRTGAIQVAEHLDPTQLNRVLLLSDGQANAGLTDQAKIAEKVAGLTHRGISTSAFGLGDGFDEDLMGAIASAGDGTLAFIENPAQLADLYASELQGLAATAGRRVSLVVRAENGAELVDGLNDFPRNSDGSWQLPNLRAGQELQVGLKLQLPAWQPNQTICRTELGWDGKGAGVRQRLIESLLLPVIAASEWIGLERDVAVAEQLAVMAANRARRRAIEQLDLGQIEDAESSLDSARTLFAELPQSNLIRQELRLLAEKKLLLRMDRNISRKRMSREYLRSSTNVWEENDDKE